MCVCVCVCVCVEDGGGITPCLKPVRIMIEIKAFLVLLMSAFFLQKISIFGKNGTFNESSVKAVLGFLVLFSAFVR